jgi:hypothetical protein
MKPPILELSNLNVNSGEEGATALPTDFNSPNCHCEPSR